MFGTNLDRNPAMSSPWDIGMNSFDIGLSVRQTCTHALTALNAAAPLPGNDIAILKLGQYFYTNVLVSYCLHLPKNNNQSSVRSAPAGYEE